MKFIKNFKLGKWSALFVIAIPLFVIGYMSNGNPIDDSIFRAFTSTFKLLTLSFDFNFALTSTNIAFKVTLYACYVAVIINDLLIATSLLSQTLYNAMHALALKRSRKDTCIVIGNNDQSIMIFKSSHVKCLITDVMNNEQKEELFLKKIHYHGSANENALLRYINAQLIKHGRKIRFLSKVQKSNKFVQWLFRFKKDDVIPRCRVIINTNDDVINIRLADKISGFLNVNYWEITCLNPIKKDNNWDPFKVKTDEGYDEKLAEKELLAKDFKKLAEIRKNAEKKYGKQIDHKWPLNRHQQAQKNMLNYLDVYSFGDINYQDNYEKYETISKGCVHYINSQTLIAKDFVTNYPLALHLTEKHVDYKTALIKDGVKVNVAFIGFGKKNKQIFLSMLATNQMMCSDGEGDIKQYDVNYEFYDKAKAFTSKGLTNYGFRYKHEFIESKKVDDPNYEKEYLTKPYFPFLENFDKRTHEIDINDHKFYENLKKQLVTSNKDNTINYIIISLGNDEETTDASSKIIEKLIQWDIQGNSYVFAGIDAESVNNNRGLFNFKEFSNFKTFGCETTIVYNYNKIVDDFYTKLAVKEKAVYDHFSSVASFIKPTIFSHQEEKHFNLWNQTVLYERMSNLYVVLSINHKLMLMGKKLVKSKDGENKNVTTLTEFSKLFNGYLKEYWGNKYTAWGNIEEQAKSKQLTKEEVFSINAAYGKHFLKDLFGVDQKELDKVNEDFMWFNRDETKFDDDSLRTNIAKLEHERWNCYMMFQGFVPLSIKDMMRYRSQKHIETREHACLTTFKGLEQLSKILLDNKIKKSPASAEYKHYDYHMMDALPLLLLNTGYVIEDK